MTSNRRYQRALFSGMLYVCAALLVGSCRTSTQRAHNNEEDQKSARTLYEMRQRYANADSDTTRWNVIRELSQHVQASDVDVNDARDQRRLWFGGCEEWRVRPIAGDINTSGDEYAPIPVDDSTLLFTRARHGSTMCATSDIYIARLRYAPSIRERGRGRKPRHRGASEPTLPDLSWRAENVGRPFNDCHESSALSYNALDSTVLVYGQYYLAQSRFDVGSVLSPSYPSDAAQTQTVAYIFDYITDFQNPALPPRLSPLIADYPVRTHQQYQRYGWSSAVVEKRGDVYSAKLINGELRGFPKRLDWPISGGDFESDAVFTPDGTAMFFVSDRPNDLFDYEAKEPHATPERLHNWGNTNIYVVPIDRTALDSSRTTTNQRTRIVNKDVIDAIRKGADTGKGLNFLLEAPINTTLAERTPTFSADGDTMFFSSNGLPGYGGMDIYFATRLKKDSWLEWSEPKNMGAGLNTAADELWFVRTPQVTYFARRGAEDGNDSLGTSGRLDIFVAERLPLVRHVRIANPCETSKALVIHTYNYDGSMTVREIYDFGGFDITDDVREFGIITNDSLISERRFMRCAQSLAVRNTIDTPDRSANDTLDLTVSDLFTMSCDESSITASGREQFGRWSIASLETESSKLRTLDAIRQRISRTSSIHIDVAADLDGNVITAFAERLRADGHVVAVAPTHAQRTTISITSTR